MPTARRPSIAIALLASLALLGAAAAIRLAYPTTKTVAVTDMYFGTAVVDPYRWLENPNDPEVKTWASAQTRLALDYLHGTPAYAGYKTRIAVLSRTSTARFGLVIRGGRLIYERQTPPEQQPQLVARDVLRGAERILFNPVPAAPGAAAPAIESVAVSPDGTKVAFTTQLAGSEDETLHVVDAVSGRPTLCRTSAAARVRSQLCGTATGKAFCTPSGPRTLTARTPPPAF